MTTGLHRVLLVDDEQGEREAVARYLERRRFLVDVVASGEEAVERLSVSPYALLITDLRLPGLDGLAVIQRANELQEDIESLLITAFASVDSAVEALRLGAQDYLLKPLNLEEVEHKARRLLEYRSLRRENARLKTALWDGGAERRIVHESPAMKEVMHWCRRAAGVRSTVLLTGETGTGKEVIARQIHALARGRDATFLAVNLAAVPETMLESELFGHERGAFTGADRRREGTLRAAGDGTVFLDEIAEVPVALQAKLLRALEANEVQPLGSDRTAQFNARVIAATHRDLEALVEAGRFRQDLFYRLNVLRLEIPPLRDRREDIPPLVSHFVRKHAARCGTPVPRVAPGAMRILCQQPWKGNVRELSNVLERAVILAEGRPLTTEALPADMRVAHPSLNLQEAVRSFEKNHIAMALEFSGGNREQAARELGISLATLYRRLERFEAKDDGSLGG